MLPAEIAQAVKRIQFVTGRQVADVMAGAYLSVFKGRGMEFDEVRPYVPGDDVRSIDWNVTARTGEPHVKRFVEERELTVMLLVDVSASQDFGSGRRSKLEAAVELSALLALSASNWAYTWLRPGADTDELADRFYALLIDGMRGYATPD